MTDKAYIVANKEQELDILSKLELDGIYWNAGEYPTDFIPSEEYDLKFVKFPYVLVEDKSIYWLSIDKLKDIEIVYDGRKEVKMTKKYKVTQEFMNELIEWKQANFNDDFMFLNGDTIADFSDVINNWWYSYLNDQERNNRLIAIIQWLNGEDVFEVEKPHKFVVRSEKPNADGYYMYALVENEIYAKTYCDIYLATKFDTREEAQEWANSHQVVVEIDEYGNEVKEQ